MKVQQTAAHEQVNYTRQMQKDGRMFGVDRAPTDVGIQLHTRHMGTVAKSGGNKT